MLTIYIQDFGSQYKLFLCSNNLEEINQKYWSFWNWGATSGNLSFDGEFKGELRYYLWSNRRNLLRYYYNILENNYFIKTGHEGEGALFRKELLKQAEKKITKLQKHEVIKKSKEGGFDWKCHAYYLEFE